MRSYTKAMEPLVSTIIPLYNRERYVVDTLESVFAQTYKNIEVIVVDDGSTDNSARIIKERYGKRIKYIYQKNQGAAAARNTGIDAATGKYVAFLDDDDLWVPGKIEKQVAALEEDQGLGFVCAGCYVINAKGSVLTEWHMSEDVKETFDSLYDGNFVLCLTVVGRTENFKKAGHFDISLKRAQDYDMWLRLAKRYRFKYINELLARYRIHGNNVSYDQATAHRDICRIINKPEIIKGLSLAKRLARNAKQHYFYAGLLLRQKRCFFSSSHYLKALLFYPFVGIYFWPPETRHFRFSMPYRILKVYCLVFWTFFLGIRQLAGFKIPEYQQRNFEFINRRQDTPE